MNRSWAYCPYDTNYKPAAELIRLIAACTRTGETCCSM